MKSIVIYFSRADENYGVGYVDKGNTEYVAEFIAKHTGADLFKVERKVPYAKDYMTCIREAQDEIFADSRPEILKTLESINDYDTVYIGGPVYWDYLPQPMVTQLEKLDFDGKTVKPFTTHEGSGLGSVVSQLKKLCKGATVKDGLAIRGKNAKNSESAVIEWVQK